MTTPSAATERFNQMRELIADILEIEPSEITETSNFETDHEADSLRAIEILATLEKEYNVEIPQEELPNMTHLSAVYEVVKKYAGWSE